MNHAKLGCIKKEFWSLNAWGFVEQLSLRRYKRGPHAVVLQLALFWLYKKSKQGNLRKKIKKSVSHGSQKNHTKLRDMEFSVLYYPRQNTLPNIITYKTSFFRHPHCAFWTSFEKVHFCLYAKAAALKFIFKWSILCDLRGSKDNFFYTVLNLPEFHWKASSQFHYLMVLCTWPRGAIYLIMWKSQVLNAWMYLHSP